MISFNYETDFKITNEEQYVKWIQLVITSEEKTEGDINYVFCDDPYLLKINQEFLNHETYTDIISFDYSVGNNLQGDIFISIDRVKENAVKFNVDFEEELARVLSHGILHYCGYKDKTEADKKLMRSKENNYLRLLMEFQ